MIPRWQVSGRSVARRSWLETWAGLHTLPLWRRLDAVFLLMVGLLVVGLLALCAVAVEAADRGGWLNAWTARPLPDERILTNVRDRLGTNPLLAAVLHGPDNALYAAQAGGTIHRYDPLTGLWRTEEPLDGRLLDRDFVQLRSGCGADPQSRVAADCPDPASLWAINRTQGLARRTADGWGVVVGDSSLLGQTGQPLQTEDLTTVAISTDGRWLAVGTRQDGVGLYDAREHRWLPTAEASRQLPSLRIGHLVWWRDRFWIGSTSGLASLTPTEDGARVESVAGLTGNVIDLDADPDGSLFALLLANCENGPTGCQQFVALDQPGGPVRELVGERRLYPELNLVGLSFAQYAGNQLAVAGQRGVYVYDATRHGWEQITSSPILATLPLPDGSGFYYAFAGGAGLYQGTDQPRWSVGDERIVRLQHGAGAEALALTERGNVYALPRNTDARLVFAGAGSGLDPERLRTGFAVGQTVVLFGPDGALLHDVGRRRYEDVAATSLPEWLKQPDLRFVSASDRLYALLPSGNSTAVYTLDGSRLADGSYYSGDLQQATPLTVPSGLPSAQSTDLRAWVWADQSLGLLGNDGSVYRVAGAAVQRVTGLPVRDLERARFLDVADDDGGLVVATDAGVRRYNAARREWSEPFRIAGKEIVELARLGSRLLGRSADNTLAQEGGQGVAPGVVIGDTGFSISDATLSDARQNDTSLFLAGQGRVERYEMATRRVAERWALAGADSVAIRALLDGKPLSLSGGQAFLADRQLDGPDQGVVRSLSTTDRQIVALREQDGRRYLKLYDIANPDAARCFFRTPTAAGATRILDARGFSDGTVAVSTDAGLRFYSPAMRSWLPGPADLLPSGGRLYIPGGNHLALLDETGPEQRLTILPISAFRLPDSCSNEPVAVQAPGESHAVRAVAVDEAAGNIAWLTPQGAVLEWTPGQPPREILAAQPDPADGPAPGELRRIYARQGSQTGRAGTLLATTDRPDRPLWRYDIAARRWTAIQVRFGGSGGPISQLVDLNLEPVGDQEIVVARTDGGNAFLGAFGPGDQAVSLGPLFASDTAGLGAPGAAILDVQDWSTGRWTFLLQDRIRTYDPVSRRWVAETPLPPDPSMQLGQAVGRPVVTAEQGRAWLVGTSRGETPPSFVRAELRPNEPTAIDANGTVWRRLPDGEVSRCDLAGDAFACRTEVAVPAAIDPASVQQVFEDRPELLLFVTTDGVRGYDPGAAQWVDLPSEVASLRGPLTVRQQGSRTFLLAGETLVTLVSDVGGGRQATTLNGVLELLYDDTGQPWVRLDDGWRVWNGSSFTPPTPPVSPNATPTAPNPPSTTGLVSDSWPTRRAGMAQLPDGRWAFEPVVRFEVDAAGTLLAARPSSRTRLADRGGVQIDPIAPLNGQWFRWDRATGSFVVNTPAGPLAIPKADFVIGDRLLWEVADAILAESTDQVHVASARGILTYRRADLLLTDGNTRFQPLALPTPIEAAHGRFRTPAGDVGISGGAAGQLTPPGSVVTFTVGDVTLREQPGRRVTGAVTVSGAAVNALTDRGFLWDVDRRGLAYENGRLLLQSAAGVHPVDQLTGFDAGPANLGTGAGRLRSEGASGALLDGAATGAGLWQRAGGPGGSPGQWQQLASDPARDRLLLSDAFWSWRLTGGQLGVALRGDAQAFAAGFGPDGFGFSTDRLLAASAHAGRLHLMTAGLFEIADTPDALRGLAGRRLPPSQTDTLEDVRFVDGSTGLFRRDGASVARLDSGSGQFQPVTGSADPYTQLPLVAADRLRLTRTSGQVQKELRLDLPAGGSGWAAFNFVPSGAAGNVQRFPFDVVTAVATSGSELYVGTVAGLVVSGGGVGLGEIQALYALGSPSGGAAPTLAPVTRIGQPLADPALVMARSDAACIERRPPPGTSGGGGFGPCRDPSLLDTRLRVQNAFWQWTIDSGGTVTGAYRDQAGQLAPVPVQLADGRLPHDALADALVCSGTSYSLWRAGWLTPHAGSGGAGLGLAPPAGSVPPGEALPRQLLCLAQSVAQAGPAAASLPAGLYAVADGGRWLRLEQAGWTPVADTGVVAGLEERRARPPVFERERLRLPPIQPDRGVVFEQRALDGRWLPLAWATGPNGDRRLEIDRWTALLQQGSQLWAATPAGLALLGRDANGRIYLDPDRWALIREPLDGDRPCAITDLEAADGVIRARCNHASALVFATQPGAPLDGQRDTGLFTRLPGLPAADPFAERTLVDRETSGRWRWRVTGRQDGQPGALVGRWFSQSSGQTSGQPNDPVSQSDSGEDLQLVGGRFMFDRMTSVALARAGAVEVGTDAGWLQAPRTRYHALDLRRPDVRNLDPTTFDAVNVTRLEDRAALCLRVAAGGGYLRLAEDGARDNPQACPQHLADDDLWRYERGEAPGLLPIRARSGGAIRQLRGGRFTDDLVAGLPVTSLESGRPAYLLPTLAGVVRLDERLTRTGIIGEGFAGLRAAGAAAGPGGGAGGASGAPGSVPAALYMLNPATPAYVGDDGLYRLGVPDAPRESLPLALPQGAQLLAVEDGPFEFMRVRWNAGGVRGASLVSRETVGTGVVGRLPLNVSGYRPFTDRRGTIGAASPWLWVTLDGGQLTLTRQDTGASEAVPLPAGWATVEPILVGGAGRHRLVLVGGGELLEINLDRLVERLYPG